MILVLLVGENSAEGLSERLNGPENGRFQVRALPCGDRDRDLSPWKAPRAFKNGSDFTGGAVAFLPEVLGALKEAEGEFPEAPSHRVIAGYSLAGLFALWALHRTPVFDCAACASPSLWYPGWLDFMRTHPLMPSAPRVALSLGDREEKSRNPILAGVGDGVRGTRDLLIKRGVPCTLRMDAGGHFENAEERTANTVLDLFRA